ncbi:ATP-binding protein [Promicromonospora thailandica]|nr:BTAD domain-containing putative transcriptional regulator [Promicromonospora thailandica]
MASGPTLRLQVLGPLRMWRDDQEVDAGPRQQASLFALLLARYGSPVRRADLIDMIWGAEAPTSAVNVVHKYVGALRRLLEPDLPPRGASSYLVRRGDGYMCATGPAVLDLARFQTLTASARTAVGQGMPEVALDRYVEALGLWHGPAGDRLVHSPGAAAVFTGLNDEFLDACTASTETAVACGRPERVLPPLRLASSMAPLHEPVHAALVTALGAAGQQAEALAVFRAVRLALRKDLGVDPGPLLERAHQRVLRQDLTPAGTPSPVVLTTPGTSTVVSPGRDLARDSLVGRSGELAVLRAGLDRAAGGGSGLVLVEGEPGVGKSRLLDAAAAEADDGHRLVARGRCTTGEGAPSMWPWMQVIRQVLDDVDGQERAIWLETGLGAILEPQDEVPARPVLSTGTGQFRLFETVVALVAHVSACRPVVIAVDDLQWADNASLQLFGHLSSRLPPGVLLLGAVRDRAPVPCADLARILAAVSRSPGHHRLRIGPLGVHDVAELVRLETGQVPDPDAARALHLRTDGNPFFVQELARLAAGAGPLTQEAVARAGIPATVRDVVRDRMAGLDGDATRLLEIAALIGRDVNLNLLAEAAGLDAATCLARLDLVQALGLATTLPDDPYSVHFAHDLVRQSVSDATPARRAARLHLRIADALERTHLQGESAPERVAHHLWEAGPLADPARTAAALVRSGRRAAAKSALDVAEQQLRLAAQISRTARLATAELGALSELTAVVGMRSMFAGAELQVLERAEHLARSLGREVEAAGILYSRWAAHVQGIDLDRCGPLAQQLRDQGEPSPHPIIRTYGLQAWGIHQYHLGNIGEGVRYLSEAQHTLRTDSTVPRDDPVRNGLQLLLTGMLAETTALHGDLDGARALLDPLESAGDDYTATVWATWSARIAAMAGDPAWALHAARRGITIDPELSYAFLGTYQRLALLWGRAATGDDPAAAADEAQRVIEENLVDPVRSCVSTWYGLLGEMRLLAGQTDLAAVALDHAEHRLAAHGQRYAEGLILLLRARLLHAQGRPVDTVRAAAETARRLAAEREAHLFVRRADSFLVSLRAPAPRPGADH